MTAVITVGFLLLIWAIVLWGSSHFNSNVQ
jgi:hypothetical protein